MKLLVTIFMIVFLSCQISFAEENSITDTYSFSLSQDPVFGFYPAVYGSLGISENFSLTFYGVLWTSPATGNPKIVGGDLMTEVGLGVAFKLIDGKLKVNPSIGVGNGLYQSGASRPLFADNIVPSLALGYTIDNFSLALNGIYWKSFRNHGTTTIDMFEYNFMVETPIFNKFNIGLFADHLITFENSAKENRSFTSYFWVGPSFKIQVRNAAIWFSSGMDFVDYFDDNKKDDDKILREFYKLTFSFDF